MLGLMSGSCDSGQISPTCDRTRRNEVTGEIYNPDEELDDNIATFPKTEQQHNHIKHQLITLSVFKTLDSVVLNTIIDAMMPVEVDLGTVLLTEGDTTTDKFYIIENGVFHGSITKPNGELEITQVYENSGHFGGVSIFHFYPSSSTVKAVTNGKLWVLDRLTYRKIVVNHASQQRQMYNSFIEKIPCLNVLTSRQKLDLADAVVPLNFNNDEVIVRKDEPAHGIYFIEFGSVKCINSEYKELSAGDYFNEHSLNTRNPLSKFTAYSIGTSKLAFLDLCCFLRLQGSCAYGTD